MAAQIQVGSEACSVKDMLEVLEENDEIFEQVVDGWQDIAAGLDTPGGVVKKTQQDFLLNKITNYGILETIVKKWMMREDKAATLEKFCQVLDKKKLQRAASLLKQKFIKTSMTDVQNMKGHSSSREGPEQMLKLLHPAPVTGFDKDIVDGPGDSPLTRVIRPTSQMRFPDDGYNLPATGEKGKVLIINIIKYLKPDSEGKDRSRIVGGPNDSQNLEHLFRDLDYADVEKHDDPSLEYNQKEIQTIVDAFRTKCIDNKVSSLIVFVGGHGCQDKLETSDGCQINLWEEVVYKFNSYNAMELINIPKIFIFQACQKFQVPVLPPNDDFHEDAHPPLPKPMDNGLVCMSTMPGYAAGRMTPGSLFVVSLMEVLRREAHRTDLYSMMGIVQDKTWEWSQKNYWYQLEVNKKTAEEAEKSKQWPTRWEMGRFKKLHFNMIP